MTSEFDINQRLELSARKLREWTWMVGISTRQTEAIDILKKEARYLVDLGLKYPGHAKRIGILIVSYRQLIERTSRYRSEALSDKMKPANASVCAIVPAAAG